MSSGELAGAVVLEAPAKLTLTLEITALRSDGFHELRAEMITVDLMDHLELHEGPRSLRVELGASAKGIPMNEDESNLVMRAMELAGLSRQVLLRKAIPAGGGLGGGSADAAAILRYAGFDDLVAAASLGGDVPFCMTGGRAMVTGIGEILQLSTPEVYRAFDALEAVERHHPRNDLTQAAELVSPRLAATRVFLEKSFGKSFWLAGSGSTMFTECTAKELGIEGASVTIEGPTGQISLVEVHAIG
ncbi:MAG: 4-(cytidine 5'-diphospho)-2-C-methyl-D-erythritol kinase [Actinobacteria bacterium]|nr:4-(cytidine 5'-diphospho)-2-C-methyl-D-erythritol kinase [Actinomycetota bacterium]